MILVEADNDLAHCVADYFSHQYNVHRVSALRDAAKIADGEQIDLLFADVDLSVPDQTEIVEDLRRNHPNIKIVLTYLAPPAAGPWEARLRDSADVIVRKPYSVMKVDETLRTSVRNGRGRTKRN